MNTPKRIQRQRSKGWRMPEGAVYVGRPTKWGNPWRVEDGCLVRHGLEQPGDDRPHIVPLSVKGGLTTASALVALYREEVGRWPSWRRHQIVELLKGRDLVCWCRENHPCHADVLLELANRDKCSYEHE